MAGATELSVLGTGADAPPMSPGPNRLGLILLTRQNGVIQGGSPAVWIARGTRARAMGPFPATWHPYTAYANTHDRSPRTPLPGLHAVELDFPAPGIWYVAVTVHQGSQHFAAQGVVQISPAPVLAGLGTRAVSTPTPVATTAAGIKRICTRVPVDRMDYISLDDALQSGKPTVVGFGTPLLCTSRLCGPVIDEELLAFEEIGKERANFIHVEEFLPGPDLKPPLPTLQNQSPAFKAWKLQTEPWVFVIDRKGMIRFRSVGPVTGPEIESALRPLL